MPSLSLTSAGELPYIEGGLTLSFSKNEVRNDVQVTRSGGTLQEATDSTSETAYRTRSYVLTPLLTTDGEALSMAQFLVSTYKDPHLRVNSMVVRPRMLPASLWPQALGREIGDRITINRRPATGSMITGEHFIEGINHAVSIGSNGWDWQSSFFTSPASQGAVWLLGVSALDTDTALAY